MGAVALGAFVIVMTETLPVGLLPQIADGFGITVGAAGLIILVPGSAAAVAGPRLVGAAGGTRAISIVATGISGGTVIGLPAGQFLGTLVG